MSLIFFRRFNKHYLIYATWLFLLINLYKDNSTEEIVLPVKEAVVVDRIDRSVQDIRTRTILLWNPWYGDFGFQSDEHAFHRAKCAVTNCILTANKTLVPPEKADAVVFLYTNLCELPKIYGRQQHQRFVLLTDDPPMCYPRNYFERRNLFGSFFNWTISYRENADVVWKRGWVKTLPNPTKKHSVYQYRLQNKNKKKKLIAWYVARCGSKSKREGYISELQEHVTVDVYGPCGNLACPETNGTQGLVVQNCLDMMADNYKFILAFERFICEDFITKRFFDILKRDVVPVVLGGADYSRIAPPHSYINALKYNPPQLVELLKELDQNDNLYYRHFWWKDFYQVNSNYEEIAQRPFCDLCKKLNDNEPSKIYRDIDAWWYNNTKCSGPEDHGITVKNKKVEDLHNIQIPWSLDD